MHKNFQMISEFFERLRTNPPRAEKIKDGYLPIIKGTKKQGLTFRMPFPEDGKTITISKSRNEKDLMRIDDNLDLVKNIQEQQDDYTEYRYKYRF